MKIILLIAFYFFLLGCSNLTEYVVVIPEEVEYTRVVDVPDASRGVLYSRGQDWLVSQYGESSVENEDDDTGSIDGLGAILVRDDSQYKNVIIRYDYGLKIQTKDGKARLIVRNFNAKADNLRQSGAYHPPQLSNVIGPILDSFQEFMTLQSEKAAGLDW